MKIRSFNVVKKDFGDSLESLKDVENEEELLNWMVSEGHVLAELVFIEQEKMLSLETRDPRRLRKWVDETSDPFESEIRKMLIDQSLFDEFMEVYEEKRPSKYYRLLKARRKRFL